MSHEQSACTTLKRDEGILLSRIRISAIRMAMWKQMANPSGNDVIPPHHHRYDSYLLQLMNDRRMNHIGLATYHNNIQTNLRCNEDCELDRHFKFTNVFSLVSAAMASFSEAPEGVVAAGAKVFKTKCSQCHVAEMGGGNKQVSGSSTVATSAVYQIRLYNVRYRTSHSFRSFIINSDQITKYELILRYCGRAVYPNLQHGIQLGRHHFVNLHFNDSFERP